MGRLPLYMVDKVVRNEGLCFNYFSAKTYAINKKILNLALQR